MSKEISFDNTQIAFSGMSNVDLTRAYWLFKVINVNFLVKVGPPITNFAVKIGLPITGIIRATIFKHFCGGESIEDCGKRIDHLGKYKIGTILDYSVEGEATEAAFDATTEETIATIKRAKSDTNIPFSVFKVTGVARFGLLEKLDAKQTLSFEEQKEFERVKDRIKRICQTAHDLDVRIFIDAEETWIQDTIDQLAADMMRLFNKKKVIVYNTIQFYRHDRLEFLKKSHQELTSEGLFIGIKLVRGAYMEKERKRAMENGYASPIQVDKASSDKDYDAGLKYCLEHLENMAICAGTHNENSSRLLMNLMNEKGLTKNDERIYFSQLLGMSDNLSYNLADAGYNVAKYVPYGPVKSVLPYLFRRAQENTAIAGQMGRELSLIVKERKRRELAK
jgi:proline dehydrogenase